MGRSGFEKRADGGNLFPLAPFRGRGVWGEGALAVEHAGEKVEPARNAPSPPAPLPLEGARGGFPTDVRRRTHERRRASEAGYTLTELLVVIVVLSLVAAAITPQVLSRFNTAKVRTAELHANTLAAALDDFFVDVGRYPTPSEGVDALLAAPGDAPGWGGPYVRSARSLDDPWGRRYLVVDAADPDTPPQIVSYGADGAEGGEGPNRDIAFP